jgi:starch synthase (maltosyl-transferring)
VKDVRLPTGDGRRRAVIEGISPIVHGGRFPIKRTVGDRVVVEADAFVDGHDVVAVALLHRKAGAAKWIELPMDELGNDRWRAEFSVDELGRHEYTIRAAVDHFATWQRDLRKRVDAGQDVSVDLLIGAKLVEEAAARAGQRERKWLEGTATTLAGDLPPAARAELALGDELAQAMARQPDLSHATTWEPPLEVVVDPVRARYSAWYELFPRSHAPDAGRHGTFKDVIARLPYVAGMGFDTLYLPPIHPIGRTFRKGANNQPSTDASDPGVPWAIGGPEGGHMALHPDLGTLDDFHALVREAERQGIALALDIAFQASPDHPYVGEHPTWFRQRPDGTVQYAENPPKKYQDIYPFDFDTDDWQELWLELERVIRFWIGQGVTVFRVDNPHTKPFAFWEWAIGSIKRDHPEILFLAEAFTRPKVMYRLAKVGFSQSYTYFTWRTGKQELMDYFTELTRSNVAEFFRPNVWPNTPDILHEVLQHGGRSAFEFRFVLAATLAATYGMYGPAYELQEHEPITPGSEEYLNSEKYQLRQWDLARPDSLAPLISTVNRIRRDHPALQSNEGLAFHSIDDDRLIAYSKRTPDLSDVVLTIVNLDPHQAHAGNLDLPLADLGIDEQRAYEAVDLLGGTTFLWQGPRSQVELDPAICPALILHLRPSVGTETHFATYR